MTEQGAKGRVAGPPAYTPRAQPVPVPVEPPPDSPPDPPAERPDIPVAGGSSRLDVSERAFGAPGRPIRRESPFYFGFVGALGVLVAYGLVQAISSARSVLVLITVSLFLAVGLDPLVQKMIYRGLGRGTAIGIVFLGVIGVFVAFGFAVVPPLIAQSNAFIQNAPGYIEELGRSDRIRAFDQQYGVLDNMQRYITSGNIGQRVFGGIVGFGMVVANTVFSAFTVLVLTLYFLAALPGVKRQAYRLVPASRRRRFSLLSDEVLRRIGGYVGGATTVATLAGLSAYVFFLVIELPYALPLALFGGLMSLIPMVGATIAALVIAGIGFFSSPTTAVIILVFYALYQQVENYVVYPRVMKRSVDVPAAATIVAALLGGALLGVLGALLAIPIAAGLLLIFREVVAPRQDRL